MTRRRRRLWVVLACGLGLGSAAALSLAAFSDGIVFFVSPSDMARARDGRTIRLGGLVEAGTLRRDTRDGESVATFRITDRAASVPVSFGGILPDLFREGQGAVMLGRLGPDGTFRASEVLAKHDETYMPRDVADALRRSGEWRPEQGPPPPAATWNAARDTADTTTKPAGG